jgi:peptide/nickel transport system permease protein
MDLASATTSTPRAVPTATKTRSLGVRLLRHPLARVGIAIIVLLLLTAVLAPRLAPHDPKEILGNGISKVGEPHPLGTGFVLGADNIGRDVFSRVIWGARISLLVAFSAMISSVCIGTVIGLLGGYFGGWVDVALTCITETVMSLPTVLLAISLFALLPSSTPQERLQKLILAITLVTWTGIARAVRGQVLALKEREFIEAARAFGCSHARILFVHLLPNVLPTVLVLATLATAHNILLEAGLSFVGQGIEPSDPSWGNLLHDGTPFLVAAPWIVTSAGAAVVLAVTGFNLLGRALEETLETRR